MPVRSRGQRLSFRYPENSFPRAFPPSLCALGVSAVFPGLVHGETKLRG
jgi:hypothetical protein